VVGQEQYDGNVCERDLFWCERVGIFTRFWIFSGTPLFLHEQRVGVTGFEIDRPDRFFC
jgi:hypothetical protein